MRRCERVEGLRLRWDRGTGEGIWGVDRGSVQKVGE